MASTPEATPRCFSCGYSIAHVSAGGRCPECGAQAVEDRDVLDGRAVSGRNQRLCEHCVLLGVVIALLSLGLYACVV
jgi:hypothetical protein